MSFSARGSARAVANEHTRLLELNDKLRDWINDLNDQVPLEQSTRRRTGYDAPEYHQRRRDEPASTARLARENVEMRDEVRRLDTIIEFAPRRSNTSSRARPASYDQPHYEPEQYPARYPAGRNSCRSRPHSNVPPPQYPGDQRLPRHATHDNRVPYEQPRFQEEENYEHSRREQPYYEQSHREGHRHDEQPSRVTDQSKPLICSDKACHKVHFDMDAEARAHHRCMVKDYGMECNLCTAANPYQQDRKSVSGRPLPDDYHIYCEICEIDHPPMLESLLEKHRKNPAAQDFRSSTPTPPRAVHENLPRERERRPYSSNREEQGVESPQSQGRFYTSQDEGHLRQDLQPAQHQLKMRQPPSLNAQTRRRSPGPESDKPLSTPEVAMSSTSGVEHDQPASSNPELREIPIKPSPGDFLLRGLQQCGLVQGSVQKTAPCPRSESETEKDSSKHLDAKGSEKHAEGNPGSQSVSDTTRPRERPKNRINSGLPRPREVSEPSPSRPVIEEVNISPRSARLVAPEVDAWKAAHKLKANDEAYDTDKSNSTSQSQLQKDKLEKSSTEQKSKPSAKKSKGSEKTSSNSSSTPEEVAAEKGNPSILSRPPQYETPPRPVPGAFPKSSEKKEQKKNETSKTKPFQQEEGTAPNTPTPARRKRNHIYKASESDKQIEDPFVESTDSTEPTAFVQRLAAGVTVDPEVDAEASAFSWGAKDDDEMQPGKAKGVINAEIRSTQAQATDLTENSSPALTSSGVVEPSASAQNEESTEGTSWGFPGKKNKTKKEKKSKK